MARNIVLLVIIGLFIFGCSDNNNPVSQANGAISGRVTVDGQGIQGVSIAVSAYIVTGGGSPKPAGYEAAAGTAADGDYRIEVLPGVYRIDFSIIIDSESLQTARYPINISPGLEQTVNVELKDPIPANLLASEEDARIELSWEPGYGADTYRVYRSEADQDNFVYQFFVSGDPHNTIRTWDSPVALGSYKYRVTGVDNGVESDPSDEVTVAFNGMISAPSGFTATDRITHVYLSWNEKENATRYKIYRSTSPSSGWAVLDSTTATNYSDIPLSFETYYYRLTAVSYFGTESEPSTEKSVNYDGRYDPPVGVSLFDRGSNFYLTWTDQDYEGYFNIYRSLDPDEDMVRIDSSFNTFYVDIPIVHDQYYYRVSVVGPNGLESDKSEAVGAFFDGRLDSPSGLLAIDQGLSVHILWQPVSWAGAYIVYRSDDDGQTYHQIRRVSTVTFIDDTPPEAGIYYYKVSTETIDGVEGLLSNSASVEFSNNLTSPVNVTSTNFGMYVSVDWNSVDNATGYRIYRSTSGGGGYFEIGQSSNTNFIDAPESAGGYYYKVRATDNFGHVSDFSLSTYVYYTDIPLPPHNVQVYDMGYLVEIDWESEDLPYQFIISRSDQIEGQYHPVDTVSSMTAVDWPPDAGHYYYHIQAMADPDRISHPSQGVHVYFSGILQTPSNLQADTTGGYVALNWNDVEGASEYDVYRGTSPELLELLQTVYVSESTDAPNTAGIYYYAVTAKTQGGLESPRSAPISIYYQP